ncbi:hypothetical protein BRM19_22145 [Xanthomonas oryzae pv. oryzae]|nr:hypothetical protein BRM19_22145 [Xanthomonas oryzae pv. oryzae]
MATNYNRPKPVDPIWYRRNCYLRMACNCGRRVVVRLRAGRSWARGPASGNASGAAARTCWPAWSMRRARPAQPDAVPLATAKKPAWMCQAGCRKKAAQLLNMQMLRDL